MRPGKGTVFANLGRFGLGVESVHWLSGGIFTPDSGTGRLLLALSRDVSSAPLVGELTPTPIARPLAAVPDRHQPQQGPDRKEAACPR